MKPIVIEVGDVYYCKRKDSFRTILNADSSPIDVHYSDNISSSTWHDDAVQFVRDGRWIKVR
jgi:hypothetical protein